MEWNLFRFELKKGPGTFGKSPMVSSQRQGFHSFDQGFGKKSASMRWKKTHLESYGPLGLKKTPHARDELRCKRLYTGFLTRPSQVSPVQLTTISRVIGFDNPDFSTTKFPGDSNNVTFFYLHTRNGMKSFLTGYESKLGGGFQPQLRGGFHGFTFWATAVPSREPYINL